MDDKAGIRLLESYDPSPSSMQQSMQHPPQQPSEAYRTSPQQQHQTSMSHAPLLPPIHHFEGQTMLSQPQYAPTPMNGAQMPPHPHPAPPYHPSQFQYTNGGMPPAPMPSNVGANGQNGMMRFPITPQPSLQMPGSRPKKDIKRRTKTGCLTCRKRRIKCDEGHPTCRNCQKSKRECLGYDPIFKQQPGPAPIQPAPSSAGSTTSKSTTSTTLPSNAYPQQPSAFPGTGGTFLPSGNAPSSVDAPFEYGGASLDPALDGGDHSLIMAANSFSATLLPERKIAPLNMELLFSLNNVPPRVEARKQLTPESQMMQQEIVDEFYSYHFAPGLDKLFETTWYSTHGLETLHHNPTLMDLIMQVQEQMKSRTEDLDFTQNLMSLEARLVWLLAILPRAAHLPPHIAQDLLPRTETIEYLLTGHILPETHIPPPPTAEHQHDHAKYNQQSFWHQLGRFASVRDDLPDPNALREINDALGIMRGILGLVENRDVLYSLAIVRHIGGRLVEFSPPRLVVPQSDDPNDEVKKLQIAQDFVTQEDSKGTTQVIQRICGMAMRSWILQKQQ